MPLETRDVDFEALPDDLGAIGVMGSEGDTKHIWRPSKPEEVAEAKLLFETLTAKGYRAYRLAKGGRRGRPMKSFDELLGKMVFTPPELGKAAEVEPPHVLVVPPFQGG